jgi:hypothetical protein
MYKTKTGALTPYQQQKGDQKDEYKDEQAGSGYPTGKDDDGTEPERKDKPTDSED